MQDYEKLVVWQRGHEVVKAVYALTRNFPRDEVFGLVSQIRRAAVSIPTNIAEGTGRDSPNDYARFLVIARSSAKELHYLLRIGIDVGYCDRVATEKLRKTLIGLSVQIHNLRDTVLRDKGKVPVDLRANNFPTTSRPPPDDRPTFTAVSE